MNTIMKAITKPDVPPRAVDRALIKAAGFLRGKLTRAGKRLPTPEAMQALRDKHPPKHKKPA